MSLQIIKRDGSIVDFDKSKIENAIFRAMKYGSGIVKEDIVSQIAKDIEDIYSSGVLSPTVYQIEEKVYNKLIEYGQELTAKAYEGYRAVQSYKRENDPLIKSVMGLVTLTNKEVMLENANKQAELVATQRDLIAGEISKTISKNYLIPTHLVQANDNGLIKIHDLDYYLNGIYNCFDKSTKIITEKGTFSFEDLGENTVISVPTHTGEWKKAIVKSYGVQDLYKMTFKRQNGMTKEVICTDNHRWILENGEVTTNLKIGDKLQETPIIENFDIENMSREEKESWVMGFVIGDGTDYTNKGSYGCQVRLCGNKNKYRFIFDELGYSGFYANDKTEDMVYIIPKMRKQEFLDNKKYKELNKNQKIALINGLYCADASLYKGNFKMLTSVDNRVLDMVRELSEVAGYYLNGEFVVEGTTNYAPKGRKPLTYIQFNKKQYRVKWKLVEKEYLKRDVVWCLEVADNHSFILSNGMVTGNCELINLEDMLQNGTVINKKKIRKPKSLRTAMTIATQISAQVSSSTYGGQTMTLSHLAPFVRISKNKIIEKYKYLKDILGDDEFNNIVNNELKAEIKDSVQTFNYQINTISSTNGQTPFISLAMYISEDEEYREETAMLIEEFLNQRIEGMENEYGIKTTQTFPKLLYFLDEDNINENSEYFYLTQLAAKSVAKRLSPDFISVKKMKELYGLAFPCMGE